MKDPANRNSWDFNAAELPAMRQEALRDAEARAPGRAAEHGVTLDWQEIARVRSLVITPEGWDGKSQMLYLFGGGFILGSPLEDLMISAGLAAGSGLQVVSPAYALAPDAPFPAGLEDAIAVARAMRPDAIAGESAGGNLALSVARDLIAEGVELAALALLSPAADMSPEFDPYDTPDDPTLHAPLVEAMPGIYAPGADPFDPRLSPLYGSFGPDWPACFITTGRKTGFSVHAPNWPGPCAKPAPMLTCGSGTGCGTFSNITITSPKRPPRFQRSRRFSNRRSRAGHEPLCR